MGWVLELMQSFGYAGLFLILVLENLFPPIPSEAVLPLAGFLVGVGEFGFWAALAASTAGAVAGALALYALGRWGGRSVVLRYGKVLRVDAESLKRAEEWFRRYGDRVVLGARLVPLARSVVSIPAGTARMPLLRFTLLTACGTAAWNAALIYAGMLLGRNWREASTLAAAYSDVALLALAAAIVAYAAFRIRKAKRR